MNRIYYFSGSGKTRRLAQFFYNKLGFELCDIAKNESKFCTDADTAVVLFPIYCQNIADPMKDFLPKLNAEKVAFVATYGRKSYGNVIEDAVKLTAAEFIGGACVPCGHSFLDEEDGFDFESLSPIIDRINDPKPAKVEHGEKVFYADLIPAQRTRIGVKISRNDSCTHCGKCITDCPMGAMEENSINGKCIRCLKCVKECTENALEFKTLWFMKLYLENGKKNETKLYF